MSTLGWFHTSFASCAIVVGAMVVCSDKGTARHKRLGWMYAISMIGMIITSLGIFRLSGQPNIFHLFSLFAFVTLIVGVVPAWRKQSAVWLNRHYFWMTYSYVGLLAAAASEFASRLPGARFGFAVAMSSAVVLVAGAIVIHTRGIDTLIRVRRQWFGS